MLPFGIILFSGLFLQTRSFNRWLQSPPAPVPKEEFKPDLNEMLNELRKIPEMSVSSWNDVQQIDMRPEKGLVRVRSKHGFMETQFSPSGKVLQVAPRRTSWIIEIHDGAFFGDTVKWWIFIPASLALLVTYFTGLWLFFKPFIFSRSAKHE